MENKKEEQAEEFLEALKGVEPSSEGLAQFKPGELLPPTTSSTVGGNQSGTEQPSKVDKLLSKLKGR